MTTTRKKTAPKVQEPDLIRYTVRHIKVDPKSTLATVVEVGPATCEVCGYDPVLSNKAKFMAESYEALDEEGQMIARNVLKKHAERHSAAEVAAAKVVCDDLTAKMNKPRSK